MFGAGALAAGVVFHVGASEDAEEAEGLGPSELARHAAIVDDVERGNTWATAGYAAGGGLLLTGAVLALWPELSRW